MGISSFFVLCTDGSIESPSQNGNLNYWEQPFSQPYFDNGTRRDVTATIGQMTYLHCRVRNLGDRSVSYSLTQITHRSFFFANKKHVFLD